MNEFSARISLYIFLVLSVQCRQSSDPFSPVPSDEEVTFSTVRCLSDTGHTYAIALPPSYSSSQHYPLVFVFDPHGDGDLAVKTLQEGASAFGCIIAGSNVIRNGYNDIETALEVFARDVLSRYAVDRERIYAVGFSGGGRVAQLFSQLNPGIRSVASAGAGYSLAEPGNLANKPSMLFITGNEDFNYQEILHAGQILSGSGIPFYVLEYPGKHAWPGPDIIRDVFQWFAMDHIRRDRGRGRGSEINEFRASIMEQAALKEKNDELYAAAVCLEKGKAFLTGISSTRKLDKKLASLKKLPGYKKTAKQRQEALSLEMRLRQGYLAALTGQDSLWWKREVLALEERISQADEMDMRPVYLRIKNFISMAAYSHCNRLLAGHDLSGAERCIAVYQVIDPLNPDVCYFKSSLLSAKGQNQEAITWYSKAIELGFSDFNKAKQELPAAIFSSVSPH